MKNNLLKLSIAVARFILVLDIFLAVLLVFFMIAWQIDVSIFDSIKMVNDSSVFKFQTSPSAEGIPLSDYGNFYFYFTCLKALIITGIIYLVLKIAIRIVRSISSIETFRIENVKSFRKMGKLFLLWFGIGLVSIKEIESSMRLITELNLQYAIWALICFILAEIFSEGNKLQEDHKLTI
ncbi:DUF2975 domain-containing protein [Ekhidna sp.]